MADMARGDSMDPVERRERQRVAAQDVSWALRGVTNAAVDVDYALARRVGLRPMDYTALNHIFVNDGAISPHHLSARLGISSGSTSELVDRLERAGHVQRDRGGEDRRRVTLGTTPATVELVLSELSPLLSALDGVASQFSTQERDTITVYLRRVAAAMREFARAETQPD
jgi:DNA-binding MarR family transcriptional regulator